MSAPPLHEPTLRARVARLVAKSADAPPEIKRALYGRYMAQAIQPLRDQWRAARTDRWQDRVEKYWRRAFLLGTGLRLCDPAFYSRPEGPGRLP